MFLIRFQNVISLILASSGIAETLLPGTAHSAFEHAIHWNSHLKNCIVSSIEKILQKCKLIVWDKCTIAYKNRSWLLIDYFKICMKISGHLRTHNNIVWRRFRANITCNSSIDHGWKQCLAKILYFLAIRKDVKINYWYVCPAAKRSISWDFLIWFDAIFER